MDRLLRQVWRWLGLGLVALAAWWAYQSPPAAMRGTWESRGHGMVFEIGRFGIDIFRVSPVDCASSMRVPANLWLLRAGSGYGFRVEEGVLRVAVDENVEDIRADPAPLPEACRAPAPLSPAETYDVVWATFAQHYPFFDLHGVDWEARATPAPAPTDAASLEAALRRALEGLDDPNVMLFAGGRAWSPAEDPDWAGRIEAFIAVTHGMVREIGHVEEAALTHGWLGDVAYLRLDHMEPGRGFGIGPEDRARELMGPLAEPYGAARGVILDLRWNRGGSDRAALGYAGLFGSEPWRFGTKETQVAPGRFTAPTALEVTPPAPAAFPQPLVVLTSARTAGAAEVLALALSELPQATVLGTPTAGALSNRLVRALPGEMGVSLSHQVTRTRAGDLRDLRGVAPDIAHAVDEAAFAQGGDSALDAAIRHLAE